MAMRRITTLALSLGAALAGAATLSAFVPSAEKELAALYPPILRGDLSACSEPQPKVTPTRSLTAARFGQRLTGTWDLKSRTVNGITVSSPSRSARLYFDIPPGTPQERGAGPHATGVALFIDRARTSPEPLGRPDGVAAFWKVAVGARDAGRVSLRMTGEHVGSYRHARIRDIADSAFFELKNVYVALDRELPAAKAWDKIVVTDKTMTHVSCEHGVVERYTKVSSQRPLVDGQSIEASWRDLKGRNAVAALGLVAPGAERGRR